MATLTVVAPVLLASGAPAKGGEAEILADRILAAQCGDCLVLDLEQRQRLAVEIGRVLAKVRELRPDLADVRARRVLDRRTLLVEAEPGLLEALAQAPERKTGYAALDALNEALVLEAAQVFSFAGTALLRFGRPVNIAAAARAYRNAEGVKSAEPDAALGGGPVIAAARHEAVWHVVVERAWGDCPSGCLYREAAFFTVAGDEVSEVEPARARRMAGFEQAMQSAGSAAFAQPR